MKKVFVLLLAFTTLLTASLEVFAWDRDREFRRGWGDRRGNEHSQRVTGISVGKAQYVGNGCPDGTMQAVFAPDNLSFSILFDQFVAEVSNGRKDIMNCTTMIPISIPDNVQMEITRVDFRGYVNLPVRGSHAVLHSVFNFRGPGGDRDRMNLRYRFEGPSAADYEISTNTLNDGRVVEQTELSPCGGNFYLRIMNQLKVVSRQPGAMATIDSIDGSSNAIYYVNWRACDKAHPGGGNRHRW